MNAEQNPGTTPDIDDRVMETESRSRQQDNDTWVKSYTYLRTAMVGLLVGLGVAVGFQTWRQDWHLLASVSAYYYTSAQAIFVGALIGLGACMIALKGTTGPEDVCLNLGGAFAAVVAIVPTSRGPDYETAHRLCQEEVTENAPAGLDCPTVEALEAATRANVENNMWALVIVGALGLVATALFAWRDRRSMTRSSNSVEARAGRRFAFGFATVFLVLAVGVLALVVNIERLIDTAHYLAALGLFLCVLFVVVQNAHRRQGKRSGDVSGREKTPSTVDILISPARRGLYTWIARAMLFGTAVAAGLWLFDRVTLFWLEIVVAAFFAVFWLVQTIEQLPRLQR